MSLRDSFRRNMVGPIRPAVRVVYRGGVVGRFGLAPAVTVHGPMRFALTVPKAGSLGHPGNRDTGLAVHADDCVDVTCTAEFLLGRSASLSAQVGHILVG